MLTFETDVLIVGGGIAGLSAACAAKSKDPKLKVTILVPGDHGTGGCSRKIHGINASMNSEDSWEQHVEDTLAGGGYINNRNLVEILCSGISNRIKDLESWGVEFNKNNGHYDTGTYAGSSVGRSLHWYDMTGLRIVQTLVERSILLKCHIREYRWAAKLVVDNGRCNGVVALNKSTGEIELYLAKATILATGGGACVYPIATISADKLATGMLMSYAAGATLVDMEMVQFHPTGLVLPGSPGHGEIMEEEVRTWGGVLLNKHGERYMPKYDPRGELATRDIVARSTYIEIMSGRGTTNDGVIFDLSGIDKSKLLERFPYMVERLRSWNIDLARQTIVEISPAAHYLMGGVVIDHNAETDIDGLFACGEDAGGIDGANRLGGNGVAGTLVFGNLAGSSAADCAIATATDPRASGNDGIEYYNVEEVEFKDLDTSLKQLMWRKVGLVRNGADLASAIEQLEEVRDDLGRTKLKVQAAYAERFSSRLISGLVLRQKYTLGSLIAKAALARTNSIGAHYRIDSKQEIEMYNITIKVERDKDVVRLTPIDHTPSSRRSTLAAIEAAK